MKKTGFVWFMMVITVLGVVLGIFTTIAEYTGISPLTYTGNSTLGIIGTILNVISFIVSIIFVVKLNKMSFDSIKWTDLTFGLYVLIVLYSIIGIALNTGSFVAAIVSNLFILVVEIVLWILFHRHLKKVMPAPAA